MFDNTSIPSDPVILLSYINTKLRDDYPAGLDALCDDLHLDRATLEDKLSAIDYFYDPASNRFA